MTVENESCAECGTRLEPGQAFCDACGTGGRHQDVQAVLVRGCRVREPQVDVEQRPGPAGHRAERAG
ncbi:hypothetical protein ACTWP5_25570, partial [Streptomyces sp. 4N509B]|uniref:hypothetical protein n=1 Tax=Streptomyces sp. 4N509B TaxID=3457413 RepID=UPI003FD4A5EF